MSFSAFFYGTLMHPSILTRVIKNNGSHLRVCPAVLVGYTRHQVEDCDYPGIVPYEIGHKSFDRKLNRDERCVRGVLVDGLTESDMQLLDIFEGDKYTREQVHVHPISHPEPVSTSASRTVLSVSSPLPEELSPSALAWTYVWSANVGYLTPVIWSYDTFVREKLGRWVGLGPEVDGNYEESEVERRRALNGFIVVPAGGEGSVTDPNEAPEDGSKPGAVKFRYPMLFNFCFAPGYINLNNGSYGSTPKPVIEATEALALECEARPDKFMRRTYERLLTQARERVARLIGANADECVIVPNATHGLNNILTNFEWKHGDIIIEFSTTYGSISRAAQYLSDIPPRPTVSTVQLTFPAMANRSAVLDTFHSHLKSLTQNRQPNQTIVAIIDGIISNPGLILPWEKMVQMCKEENVWSVVDAAHCIGQVDVDLSKAQPDFWVSNCHKWLSAKRGCAILYVPKRNQHMIKSTFPTSAAYKSPSDARFPSNFVTQYDWTGTQDFIPYLSINSALDFRESIGGEKMINDYCHRLALEGGKRLAEVLETRVLNEAGGMTANMVDVLLPLPISPNATSTTLSQILTKIQDKLLEEHDCFAAPYEHDRKWWVRCSAQIWNQIEDFDHVGKAFLKICRELKDEDVLDLSAV